MRIDLGAYGSVRQGAGGQVRLPVQPRQMGDATGDIVAALRGLSAEVRRLGARVQALESSVGVLDKNDQRLAGHINQQLGELTTQVDQKMMTVAKRLLTAAGRGVQPQQLVPLATNRDYPVYQTPPERTIDARVARMMTQPGPAAEQAGLDVEPVDRATSDDALFYAGADEEEDD